MAGMGATLDARTGSVSEDIGTSHDPIVHEIAPPDTHGHNTIYLDSSITFENYLWWANKSREHEKHVSTDHGISQLFKAMLGKSIRKEDTPPTQVVSENEDSPDHSDGPQKHTDEKPEGFNEVLKSDDKSKPDRWGVTEADWETAQRATRTATWGEFFNVCPSEASTDSTA